MIKQKGNNIYALICARQGSKGLKDKNIKPFMGKPLICHSIDVALKCERIRKTFVSTDSAEIAEIAEGDGATVPFLRPPYLAKDTSPEWLVWRHMLEYLGELGEMPDALVVLPPTSPLRSLDDVNATIDLFLSNDCDGVLCGSPSQRNPEFNMVKRLGDGRCALAIEPSKMAYRRQDAKEYFDVTTVCYVMEPSFIQKKNRLFEGKILLQSVPQERSVDIDNALDFEWAEYLCKRNLA